MFLGVGENFRELVFQGVGFFGCRFDWAAVHNQVADAKMFVALALHVGPEFFIAFVRGDYFIDIRVVGVTTAALGYLFDFIIFLF